MFAASANLFDGGRHRHNATKLSQKLFKRVTNRGIKVFCEDMIGIAIVYMINNCTIDVTERF